jgi:hypothetical protein
MYKINVLIPYRCIENRAKHVLLLVLQLYSNDSSNARFACSGPMVGRSVSALPASPAEAGRLFADHCWLLQSSTPRPAWLSEGERGARGAVVFCCQKHLRPTGIGGFLYLHVLHNRAFQEFPQAVTCCVAIACELTRSIRLGCWEGLRWGN